MDFSTKNEEKNVKKLSLLLLRWFRKNKRDLPWRHTRDPYAIMVSEMMLQQTQVKTVIPYYHKWLHRWPDWNSLAKSNEEEVIKAWEGLGYYSRARALLAIARIVVQREDQTLPRTREELMELPGVGPYTAGAVASIAFGQRVSAIDGNVIRVVSRVWGLDISSSTRERYKKVETFIQQLLPRSGLKCGDFNQALMELGATLCTPRSPDCLQCPWNEDCEFNQKKRPSCFVYKTKKKITKSRSETWAWLVEKGKLWCQRPSNDKLLQGLWTLPAYDPHKMIAEKVLEEIRFSISNTRVTAKIIACSRKPHIDDFGSNAALLSPQEIQALPFAAAPRKFIRKMGWTTL
ncbi:MAG: A/G-specific adenine glycosylase [Methylacidiphilales bacterium]|nr:A/G-specific adenine glycosylase [Candidatus Methylacidiphilales bacterium]MDW8349306.1 A/G-specific adenine glycosylase [Verrucomicrobiae bacterium]